MGKVSKDSAAEPIEEPGFEGRYGETEGYTIGFEKYTEHSDMTPLLVGLPNDQCQSPHWGYVFKGKLVYHTADGDIEIDRRRGLLRGPRSHAGGLLPRHRDRRVQPNGGAQRRRWRLSPRTWSRWPDPLRLRRCRPGACAPRTYVGQRGWRRYGLPRRSFSTLTEGRGRVLLGVPPARHLDGWSTVLRMMPTRLRSLRDSPRWPAWARNPRGGSRSSCVGSCFADRARSIPWFTRRRRMPKGRSRFRRCSSRRLADRSFPCIRGLTKASVPCGS